ncbi:MULTISPECIES: hypothetical protein [Variovorax]|jgi:ElaB/YqjD/DUF883 family membrane-anchored ribosome-binding protein|uniref:hypothetical protein n=1 Tax=Variovorax TaxID=34072 RepID=UPI00089950E1|nr:MULTISPECIES: hypothetical protein [Variovorax]MDQ0083990.1 ElaB/YqjD/DUF883 family membrane-anchored ribosome-binding protein [Variovorax boronicumulans]UVH58802.1 hypothetical protein NWF24_05175 [Variovorax paradoxus]SDY97539.1 Membrane-anchored ribosome-binding protein, inhibits growth in stationary phase, ElaB/YqjD/DUF883 family [Variovorax sp. YR634]SDZ70222.1 Membrane-anchored ribosome-binding protein, inhibits growth in stationary phase, ElaB/YqjD/DUF883 family [Variovorax sp. YR266]
MNTTTKTPSQLADDVRQTAREAVETTRAYAQNAVNAAGEKVRDLQRDAEPGVEQLAARVQQAVQRGLDAASTTSARAQRRIEQAADVTGRYISDQPVRSVLLAAAAGAAITALIVLASRRSRDDY